ncbi:MAG: cytochrome c maturation protein CcmE [Cyclobacteriaceae bacterium]|nr:cytochrome c maturation protein CcmE [Cyclobacteriaceae bacterium]
MKKTHIFIIVVIAVAVAIIVSSTEEASTYVTFSEAYQLASNGNSNSIHVVGDLTKDSSGKVIGIEPGEDKVSFSFVMIDEAGKEQQIHYNQPMPQDFTRSEKVVVIGSYKGDTFFAEKILLKCPSKYQEEKLNAGI